MRLSAVQEELSRERPIPQCEEALFQAAHQSTVPMVREVVITRGRIDAHRGNGDDLRAGRGMLPTEAKFNMAAWLLREAAHGDVRRLPEGL
jgi:hypothetical protein